MMSLLWAGTAARAEAVAFESGPPQTHLLELYTSEGCSSCPPAEAWLAALKSRPELWKDYVPVAFHVDYWNSLGWPDPYSSPQFTQRQHDYATAWRADTVYTPEFVLDGAEWRRGLGNLPPASREKPGILSVKVEDGGRTTISFHPASGLKGPFFVTVAPLGFGIITDVRGGENGGRKLAHEFVALALQRIPLSLSANGSYETRLVFPSAPAAPAQGVAAWVTIGENLTPIQAAGGLFDRG